MVAVKRVATLAAIAAFGAVSSNMLAPPASANGGTWAAVAFSMNTQVKGLSYGYPVETGVGANSAGAQRAVQECANHPLHPTDCRFLASGPCVALAERGSEYYQSGYGATREEAENAVQFPPNEAHATEMVSVCSDSDVPGGESSP